MAGATGSAVLDFGAAPGSNEASVTVLSQADISSTSKAEAFFMAETGADHTANDHAYVPIFCALTCSTPSAGVGFTIYARSVERLTGEWNINWVWAD